MDEAFVPVARKFFHGDLWKEGREFSRAEAWLYMIASASYAPEAKLIEGRCVNLRRGELAASQRYLAQKWTWSKSKVARFLENLTAAGRVRTRNEPGLNVITLCNYERFNGTRSATGPPMSPTPDHLRTKVEEGEEPPSGEEALLRERAGARSAFAEEPSWEEVWMHAQRIGLAEWKARDWFDEMQGVGWLDYAKRPIQKWSAILNRVTRKWEADGRPMGPPAQAKGGAGGESATQSILSSKELDRIDKRITEIKMGYDSHQSFNEKDRAEMKRLWTRKRQLKEKLGFTV